MAVDFEPITEGFGAVVRGLNLGTLSEQPCADTVALLEAQVARRGFLVFQNVSLPGDALVSLSKLFGSGDLAARHTVHPEAVHDDMLRLSNVEDRGVVGVGRQWHHDGAFERRPFSHVVFHAQQIPPVGGGTQMANLARAFASLSPRVQSEWSRLASVNAFSGAVHPLVHQHPKTGQRVLFAHLAQTGAVIRWPRGRANGGIRYPKLEAMDPAVVPPEGCDALPPQELRTLLGTLDALLNRHTATYNYDVHDLLLLDNLAVAHRAAPWSWDGLRVLHRTTVAGLHALDPPHLSQVPPFVYVWGVNPLNGDGVWQGSDYFGAGFPWNDSLPMRN